MSKSGAKPSDVDRTEALKELMALVAKAPSNLSSDIDDDLTAIIGMVSCKGANPTEEMSSKVLRDRTSDGLEVKSDLIWMYVNIFFLF